MHLSGGRKNEIERRVEALAASEWLPRELGERMNAENFGSVDYAAVARE